MLCPWCSLSVSFLESSAWLTCITIQSKSAPYRHLAIASLVAIASGSLRNIRIDSSYNLDREVLYSVYIVSLDAYPHRRFR